MGASPLGASSCIGGHCAVLLLLLLLLLLPPLLLLLSSSVNSGSWTLEDDLIIYN
jgi:hypothetical protein